MTHGMNSRFGKEDSAPLFKGQPEEKEIVYV